MKEKRIGFEFNGEKSKIKVYDCNFFERFRGLMFTRKEKARALLFDFNKPTRLTIHSIFVFFPFVAIWLDDKNKIVDLRVVKPFTLSVRPEIPYNKLVEIPINRRYNKINKILCSSAVIRKIYKDH